MKWSIVRVKYRLVKRLVENLPFDHIKRKDKRRNEQLFKHKIRWSGLSLRLIANSAGL